MTRSWPGDPVRPSHANAAPALSGAAPRFSSTDSRLKASGGPEWAAAGVLLAVAIVLTATLSQRFFITVDTGGRGVVSVFVPVTLCLGAMSLFGGARGSRRIAWGRLLGVWGPFWACVGLLPLFAVVFQSYPPRILASSVTEALVPMAIVVIGVKMGSNMREPTRALSAALVPAVLLVLGYAVLQAASRAGLLDPGLWAPFGDWDRSVADAFGVLVGSRPSGPYVNPNILGAWGAIAFVLSATLVRGQVSRPLSMGAAALTVLVAQSRGPLVALIAGAVVLLLIRGEGGRERSGRIRAMFAAVAATVVAVVAVNLIGGDVPGVSRFIDGLVSLAPGSTVDSSLAQRFDFWAGANALSAIYPLGTFGPPEMLLGTAIDNDWIRLFLQASIAGVAAMAIMLIGGAILADRSRLSGRALTACSVVVAVCAITETPLTYPPISLYWLIVGFSIVSRPVQKEANHG